MIEQLQEKIRELASQLAFSSFVAVISILLFTSIFLYVTISELSRLRHRLPGIPGPLGSVITGNLYQLGPDPAEQLRLWGKKYGGVFQIMMGNMPVVVFTSMKAAKDVFNGQGSALIDRPSFYTFHKVLSSKVSSVGTTGWTESNKRRRKAAAHAMNRVAVETYVPFMVELTNSLLADLLEKGQGGDLAFDFKPSVQHMIVDLGMTVNFGSRLPQEPDLFDEINYVEDNVSRFRSVTGTPQDYVPMLRFMPLNKASAHAREINRRRLLYLERFNRELDDRIEKGVDSPCIQGNCKKDPDARLDEIELLSISMSMIGGGLDTMVNTTAWTIGTLARRSDIQEAAYNAIVEAHSANGWIHLDRENGVPYITALVKECLRWTSVFRLSLPRRAYRDVFYEGMRIPQGTTVMLNAYGCNRDQEIFGEDVNVFRPERFLESNDGGGPELPHATYGFGTRMCAGALLANRQLYILFLRLIWAFKIELSKDENQNQWAVDPLKDVTEPFHFAAIPPLFAVRFVPRDRSVLDDMLSEQKT